MSRNQKLLIGAYAVLGLFVVGGGSFLLGRSHSSSALDVSDTTSMAVTTTSEVIVVPASGSIDGPVSTNFTVTSVQYPLVETPENTNPPDANPDMQIQFVNSTTPDAVRKLKEICPLTFSTGTKFCVQVDVFTGTDDPYSASAQVGIRDPMTGCMDFSDCFSALKGTPTCGPFLTYLDSLVRDLVVHGYNSDGLTGLDPKLVRISYWDVNTENRELQFGTDCSVVAVQR